MLMQQTNVADITGLTAFVSRRVSIGLFLLTCICLLFALSSLLVVPPVALLWLALAVICIIALVRGAARRGNTGVIIYSRADGHSPISFGTFDARRGLIGSLAQALGGPFLALFGVFTVFDVLVGFPGQHVEDRSEEHTSELQSHLNLVCRLLLEKKNKYNTDLCFLSPPPQNS